MKSKVSIEIEKREGRYSAYSPEIKGYIAEGNSLDPIPLASTRRRIQQDNGPIASRTF
jgi:hypothetical protein